jgi:hypothetical protein
MMLQQGSTRIRERRNRKLEGTRVLDTAEGILIGLRRCRSEAAFEELISAAERNGIPFLPCRSRWSPWRAATSTRLSPIVPPSAPRGASGGIYLADPCSRARCSRRRQNNMECAERVFACRYY